MNVTARCGHHPMSPGGFPRSSASLQYSTRRTASCSTALVPKSNAASAPPAPSSQSHVAWRIGSWHRARTPPSSHDASGQNSATLSAEGPVVRSTYSFANRAAYPLA